MVSRTVVRIRSVQMILKFISLSVLLSGCRRDQDDEALKGINEPAKPTSQNVIFEKGLIEELGIQTEDVKPIEWARTRRVYGRVVPNPNATYEMQSASAGTIHSLDKPWPKLGQEIEEGHILGYLAIRIAPEIRLDLENRLADARLKTPEEEEIVRVQTRTVESLRQVTQREILSRSEFDSAIVNLQRSKMQLESSRESVKRLEQSLSEIDDATRNQKSLWNQPIVASHSGVVSELHAVPGSIVEAGRMLLQIVDTRMALVRLDIPSEFTTTSINDLNVQIANGVFSAKRVGLSSTIDTAGQFQSTLFEVTLADAATSIRPGLQAISEFPVDGSTIGALLIPSSAVVVHEGLSYVYVQLDDSEFQRREVNLLQRTGSNWIVEREVDVRLEHKLGLNLNHRVVSRNAQVLLSKQFLKSGGDPD